MAASRAKFLGLCLLLSIYFLGIGTAFLMDRDFGRVEVRMIAIPDVGKRISGLLYRPVGATPENPLPAVVLTHGISGSKQMVSGIALELAKRGFVALAIDLVGHGNSEGAFGIDLSDPSLGILAAVRHLRAQPYVDGSRVGLVGHSLGAGAVRAAAFANGNVSASVFVGGGLGGVAEGPSYGEINRTFPKNLLVAVGAHDVLFDLGGLTMELGPAFGAPREVDPCVLYGDFSLGTARKLVTPPTTHLFEPVDPSIVSEIVLWMEGALGGGSSPRPDSEVKLSYAYREAAVSSSLAAFVGLIFSISSIIFDSRPPQVRKAKAARGTLEGWNAAAIWGALGLAAFLPMFLVGFFIQFPPLIFGSSFAWWLLAVAALGFLLIALVVPRVSSARTDLKASILESFAWNDVAVAAGVFAPLYLLEALVEAVTLSDLRIFAIPAFNDLVPSSRVLAFLEFVPFFLPYFLAEGLYFHELRGRPARQDSVGMAAAAMEAVAMKVAPYAALLVINYAPTVLLNAKLLPTFIGFLSEFFWGVLPLFAISMACSWWFYWKTSSVWCGAAFNALLFSWSAAATFPFGASSFHTSL